MVIREKDITEWRSIWAYIRENAHT